MNPISQKPSQDGCVPQSSNCVIWQGPDLPCIHLCKGDSVSDVVYKLAVEICELKTTLDLTDLDISCLLTICETTPQPAKTLANIFDLLINKVCCLNDIIQNLPSPGNDYTEPTLDLPECLWIPDGGGGYIKKLIHHLYTLRIAAVLCSVNATVIDNTSAIDDLDTRVTALENPPVTPTPSYISCLTGTSMTIDEIVIELEAQFCDYKTALGSTTDLIIAQSRQCITGANDSLSTSGTMASLSGWQNTVTGLGQSIQNLWITVCDMREAILALKNCCAVDCTQFILGFNPAEDGTRQLITLTFNALTTVPSGFSNCPALSTVVIQDEDGHIYSDTLDLVAASTDPGGVTYDISTAGFNTATAYTITVTGCVTKDGYTCEKTATGTLAAPTTTTTTSTTTTTTTVLP